MAAVVDLGEWDPFPGRDHEELPDSGNPRFLSGIGDRSLLVEEIFHERGESEPDLAIGVAVELEKGGVALDGAGDLGATAEAELAVELSGVVEEEDLVGLFGEEVFGSDEESEEGVALGDEFEVLDAMGFVGLDGVGARGFGVLLLLLALLLAVEGGVRFSVDWERGWEGGGDGREMGFGRGSRVLEGDNCREGGKEGLEGFRERGFGVFGEEAPSHETDFPSNEGFDY